MVAFRDDRFPVGSTSPTIGFMRSLTSELTTADEATPMTKPMARPTTPKVWRKSTNSLKKPFFFSEAFSILSMDGERAWTGHKTTGRASKCGLVLSGVAVLVSDGVDESLSLGCFFDGEVEDALVVDFEKLCEVFGDQEILARLYACR